LFISSMKREGDIGNIVSEYACDVYGCIRKVFRVENVEDVRIHKRYLLFCFFFRVLIFSSLFFFMFTIIYIISLALFLINILDPNRLSSKIPCERVSARCGGSANPAAFYKVRKNDIYTCRSMRKKRKVKIFSVRIYYDRV